VAICFTEFRVLSTSEADLPTGLAAYIARARYRSRVTGETFDHRWRGRDLIWSGVFLPKNADPIYADPGALWSAMERAEIRRTPKRGPANKLTKRQHEELLARIDDPGEKCVAKEELVPVWRENAQLAYAVLLALPKELAPDQLKDLVRDFVNDELVRHGFACQVAIHTTDNHLTPNVHAHLLIATREIHGLEVGRKIRGALGRFAGHKEYGSFLAQSALGPDQWAAYQNNWFLRHGIDLRVDPKSPAPQTHVGRSMWVANSDALQAVKAEKAASRAAVTDEKILLELMTEGQPTVTEADVARVLERHGLTTDERKQLFARLLQNPNFLPLFDPRNGAFSGRFSSKQVRSQEHRIVDLARRLHGRKSPSGRKPTTPVIGLCRSPLTILEHPSEALRTQMMRDAEMSHLAAGYRVVPLAVTPPIAYWMSATGFPSAKTVEQALLDQTGGTAPAWNHKTCILINQADLLSAEETEQVLAAAVAAGARVILVSTGAPSYSLGRGGSFAAIRAVAGPTTISSDGDLATPSTPGGWRKGEVLPSIAFDAPRDRKGAIDPHEHRRKEELPVDLKPIEAPEQRPGTSSTRELDHGDPPSRLPAPRPWRHPDLPASLCSFYNLSCAADCQRVAEEARVLPADKLFRLLRSLPSINAGGAKPSAHPLATLTRQLWGYLRRSCLDVATGRTRTDCLRWSGVDSDESWHDREDLEPRQGFVDVRPLLADISLVDNDDWRKLLAHMAPFPVSALKDIVGGLDDLFERFYNNDDIKYAVSFAKLQIWVMGKDTGRDLVPEAAREDLWSLIPSADRIRRGLRLHDRGKPAAPILAATLSSTRSVTSPAEKSTTTPYKKPAQPSPEPLWLEYPDWSQNEKFFGDDPNSRSKFHMLNRATDAQRQTYQARLLEIFATCRHLGIRAWVGVGIDHLASWHRQNGAFGAEIDPKLDRAHEEAKHVIMAWKGSKSGLAAENPFTRGRLIFSLRKHTIDFLAATEREKQLRIAERFKVFHRHYSMPAHFNDLVTATQSAANYLRTVDPRQLDPLALAQLFRGVRAALAADLGEDAALIGCSPPAPQVSLTVSEKDVGSIRPDPAPVLSQPRPALPKTL